MRRLRRPQGVFSTLRTGRFAKACSSDAASATSARLLEAQRAHLALVVASLDDLFFSLDLEGRFIDYHAPAKALLYVPPEAFLGRRYHEVMPPEIVLLLDRALATVASSGNMAQFDYRLDVGGREAWWAVKISLRLDGDGRAAGFTVFSRDITDRVFATAALAQREAQLRAIFDVVPLGLCLADPKTRVLIQANERMSTILGYSVAELVGMPVRSLTHPDDQGLDERHFFRVAKGEIPEARFEKRYVRKDGGVVWGAVNVTSVPNPRGGIAYLLATIEDITAQKRTQAALSEVNERYRGLVDNLEHVVFSTDLDGRMTFVNRAVERFGYKPEDVIGRPRDAFVHPDDVARLRALYAMPERPHGMVEYRMLDAAGKVRIVRSATRPLVVDGQVVGATGVLEDLTAQRETEEQLRVAQRMEAVGRLAGGVAHDFNNLLTVILSYTDFVMAELGSDALRNDLAEVERAARRAEALTRQLLAFSRRQVLRPEAVSLAFLVDGVSKMLRRLIGEDIDLCVSTCDDLYDVLADRGQMEQVIVNLVINARDAMPDGGRVEVKTSNVDLDCARAGALQIAAGPYVELAITDTGHGMDAATRARVFEPFFSTKPVGKGTGLGLAMVYGLVRQSGGAVTVESEPGRGATFRVFLPRHEAAAVASGHPSAVPAQKGSETVLLVEDESALRSAARRMLSSAGYQVVTAADAAEALRVFEANASKIKLVITDVVMPGMNGKELASHIVARNPSTRVLFTSGYTDETIAHHGVLGPNFLPKPYERNVLCSTVRRVLDAS
ncbi:MAG: PAS domain S-box protein [Polyangiales bacterium]